MLCFSMWYLYKASQSVYDYPLIVYIVIIIIIINTTSSSAVWFDGQALNRGRMNHSYPIPLNVTIYLIMDMADNDEWNSER